jgi:DNA-binding SARP family transcriptional activator/tetratricopeptide (TPR) repeat protein
MLRIELLGGFRVWCDGVVVTTFHSQKAQALLAYLVLFRQRAHPRSFLAGLLWGDCDETHARANLRCALHWLRKVLKGPYLLSEGASLRFNTKSEYSLDVEEFERKFEDAAHGEERASLLQEAVALYQGDLLVGFYDDWVLIEQERLRELYLQTLKDLSAYYTEHKEYTQAIAWARRALAANPLQEEVHRALMQLYVCAGDRAAALQQYADCAAVLQTKLNVQPLPEMRALHEQLLKGLPLEVAPPQELPAEVPFVGRERELEMLQTLWGRVCQSHGQVVLVEGEIGVGKTCFVQRFIEHIRQPHPGLWPPPSVNEEMGERSYILQGAACADELPYFPVLQAVRNGLQSVSTETLEQLPVLWRSELAQFVPEFQEQFPDLKPNPDLPPTQEKARWFAALTAFFELLAREHPLMLFLDDLHWVDKATLDYLSYLMACMKELRILLIGTYRAEEAAGKSLLRTWLDRLGPGDFYSPLVLPRLSREETSLLLGQLLRWRDGAVFDLLYAETEGNPLFLVKLVRSLVQSGALRSDAEGRWKLVTSEISAAHLPESLQEVIRATLRRVPGRAQSLLGLAAVIGRAFELPVLREVLHQAEEKLLDRLDELCRTGLIVEHEGRYQSHHELVRQVVYEGLSADRKKFWHRRVGQALEVLYADRLDRWAGELARHFEQAQLWEKAVTYLMQAAARAQITYDYSTAKDYLNKALKLFKQLETSCPLNARLRRIKFDLFDQYTGRGLFPTIYDMKPVLGELQATAAEMIALAQQLGDDVQLCKAYQRQARLQLAQGQLEAAWEFLLRAFETSQRVSDLTVRAEVLENMASLHARFGRYDQSWTTFAQAIDLWAVLGNVGRQGQALMNLAITQTFLGKFVEAQNSLEKAQELFQAVKDVWGQAATANNLGDVLYGQGQYQSAQSSYERAYQLNSKQGDHRGAGITLINLGVLQTDQERYSEALSYFERVFDLLKLPATKGLEIGLFSEKSRAHLGQGKLELALDYSTRAIRLLEEHRGVIWEAQRYYFTHCKVLQANQQVEKAHVYLQKAYEELCRLAGGIQEEALRKSFLENVPMNRQILKAWQAAQHRPTPLSE